MADEKPSLTEAIENAKESLELAEKQGLWVCRCQLEDLRRLVEAGEFEERWIKIWKEKEPSTFLETVAEKDRRIKELKEENAMLEGARWKEDQENQELRSRLAEKEREQEQHGETLCNQRERIQDLKEKTLKQSELFFKLERELKEWKDHAWKLDQSIIKLVKTFGSKPPTDAEVDKVAVIIAREMDRADELQLSQSREVARHVLRGGYRPKEE